MSNPSQLLLQWLQDRKDGFVSSLFDSWRLTTLVPSRVWGLLEFPHSWPVSAEFGEFELGVAQYHQVAFQSLSGLFEDNVIWANGVPALSMDTLSGLWVRKYREKTHRFRRIRINRSISPDGFYIISQRVVFVRVKVKRLAQSGSRCCWFRSCWF